MWFCEIRDAYSVYDILLSFLSTKQANNKQAFIRYYITIMGHFMVTEHIKAITERESCMFKVCSEIHGILPGYPQTDFSSFNIYNMTNYRLLLLA